MKAFILSAMVVVSMAALQARAEEKTSVKINDMDTTQDTTISIKKGANPQATKKWVLTEGEEDISGDKAALLKQAETNWKTACSDWKKEFKEMNKDNKIVSMSCGKMSCSKEGVESTCVSKATHKVKTLSEE
jgi:hypothetical protein